LSIASNPVEDWGSELEIGSIEVFTARIDWLLSSDVLRDVLLMYLTLVDYNSLEICTYTILPNVSKQ
jgi:hypothetical protein